MRHQHGHRLFISHAWSFGPDYVRLVNMLDRAPDFAWCNYSVGEERPFLTRSGKALRSALRDQIRRAQVVLIVGGMETRNREWMLTELEFARDHFQKPIVWVRRRGAIQLPAFRTEVADLEVGWSTKSIVGAIEWMAANRN